MGHGQRISDLGEVLKIKFPGVVLTLSGSQSVVS